MRLHDHISFQADFWVLRCQHCTGPRYLWSHLASRMTTLEDKGSISSWCFSVRIFVKRLTLCVRLHRLHLTTFFATKWHTSVCCSRDGSGRKPLADDAPWCGMGMGLQRWHVTNRFDTLTYVKVNTTWHLSGQSTMKSVNFKMCPHGMLTLWGWVRCSSNSDHLHYLVVDITHATGAKLTTLLWARRKTESHTIAKSYNTKSKSPWALLIYHIQWHHQILTRQCAHCGKQLERGWHVWGTINSDQCVGICGRLLELSRFRMRQGC